MKLVYLLRVYQPPYQSPAVLAQVVEECFASSSGLDLGRLGDALQ